MCFRIWRPKPVITNIRPVDTKNCIWLIFLDPDQWPPIQTDRCILEWPLSRAELIDCGAVKSCRRLSERDLLQDFFDFKKCFCGIGAFYSPFPTDIMWFLLVVERIGKSGLKRSSVDQGRVFTTLMQRLITTAVPSGLWAWNYKEINIFCENMSDTNDNDLCF